MTLADDWSRNTDLRKPETLFASGSNARSRRIEQPHQSTGLFRVIWLVVAPFISALLLSTSSASWAKPTSSRSRLTRHVARTQPYLGVTHHSGKPRITTRQYGDAYEQSQTERTRCTPETAAENIDKILAAPPETLRALRAVQAAPRLDPVLLLAIARAESRFDPEAQNRLSSARGLLQFTRDTWLEVMRQFGAQHGFPVYAKAIRKDQTGRLSVDRPATLRAILRLRDILSVVAVGLRGYAPRPRDTPGASAT